jgi:hypothetical protein
MKDLRASWPSRGWSWDSRLSCVTSSFSVELEPKARSALGIVLLSEWTATSIRRAPAGIRELADRTGGVRSGQSVFARAVAGDSFAYGLWWPWGDGMTTSMRIGIGGPDATDSALQELRDAFGVEV